MTQMHADGPELDGASGSVKGYMTCWRGRIGQHLYIRVYLRYRRASAFPLAFFATKTGDLRRLSQPVSERLPWTTHEDVKIPRGFVPDDDLREAHEHAPPPPARLGRGAGWCKPWRRVTAIQAATGRGSMRASAAAIFRRWRSRS